MWRSASNSKAHNSFFGPALSSLAAMLAASAALAGDAPSVTWRQLAPTNTPPPRGYMAMIYDGASHKTVMFGGYAGSYLNDTWTFDGTTWSRVNTPVAPPGRSSAQMAYDRRIHKVVLFGGYNGRDLGDTWLWDGSTSTWTQATPAHSPGNLTGPIVFTDPNGHVDEFGGYDGNFYQLTMWQWNGVDWVKLQPPTVPYARAFTSAATDFFRGEVVTFGGLADVNPVNTWTFDGTTWTQQSPTTQPNWVYSSSSSFDPNLHAVVLFGGGSGAIEQDTTWAWNGSNWFQVLPAQSPAAREGAGMTYDKTINQVLLFGGQGASSVLGDTWALSP
jgi:hypothetical protein